MLSGEIIVNANTARTTLCKINLQLIMYYQEVKAVKTLGIIWSLPVKNAIKEKAVGPQNKQTCDYYENLTDLKQVY